MVLRKFAMLFGLKDTGLTSLTRRLVWHFLDHIQTTHFLKQMNGTGI
ncbi:similar to RIKEN cDNA 2010311D03, isoform CRA_c [Rattus norvegicus]|uniref:Similar to RIKEN cDNA 2010311D03, isoform CRA_c n=1 Tax=Rattus norvegicus TaxID=10116 RepID=A6JF03_RAT|nr:similar to RIKEN cDNA 2010311D03, isoform CRA_c [Rattus norvegicus]